MFNHIYLLYCIPLKLSILLPFRGYWLQRTLFLTVPCHKRLSSGQRVTWKKENILTEMASNNTLELYCLHV